MTHHDDGAAGSRPRTGTLLEKLRQQWTGDLRDERQQAVWNEASASALYLTVALTWLATIVFMVVDFQRYEACIFVFFGIAMLGLTYAEATARRKNVRPVPKQPSLRRISLMSLECGSGFFLLELATGRSPDWRSLAVESALFGVLFGIAMRFVLANKRARALQDEEESS